MKNLILILTLALSVNCFGQVPVSLTTINQYGRVRGGLEIDSAFTCIVADTLSPNVKFPNQRRVGREVTMPGTFRKYVWDGTKYRPYNTFLPSMETKLNSVQPGATANLPDAQLLDLSNHTGMLSYSMLTDVPNLNLYMKYIDTLSMSNRINARLLKSDTTGKWRSSIWLPTYAQILSKPNTLSGFGITDAMTASRISDSIAMLEAKINLRVPTSRTITINGDSKALTSNVSYSNVGIELPSQAGQSGKVLSTNGTSPQWVNSSAGTVTSVNVSSSNLTVSGGPVTSSGSITVNLPNTGTSGTYGIVTTDSQGRVTSGKRQETYSGTTNASGLYTVTFPTSYSAAPNVQVAIQGDFASYTAVVSAKSTTGFTVKVYTLSSILSLGLVPQYSPVPSVNVDVLVTEK